MLGGYLRHDSEIIHSGTVALADFSNCRLVAAHIVSPLKPVEGRGPAPSG
jgi:hypothetical protein